MASGWARDGAVQDQVDASIDEAVQRARSKLPSGHGLLRCQDCDEEIPRQRRAAVPGVRRCVACQAALDDAEQGGSAYNRRGSKDSQLR